MIRALFLATLFALTASPASAAPDPGAVCDAVSDVAAREAGLPPAMLRALTRTETGRARGGRLTPWPWTVNMEGAGHWFDDRQQALAFVRSTVRAAPRRLMLAAFKSIIAGTKRPSRR